MNGKARTNNAAVKATTGVLLGWAPVTNLQGDAIVIEPGTGQIVLGGRFTTVNGIPQRGLANVHPGTGALNDEWQIPDTVQNGRSDGKVAGKAGIFSLTTDATGVYGTGWRTGGGADVGTFEGTFAAEAGSGKVRWLAHCYGDSYGVYSTGKVVYSTSHTQSCQSMGGATGYEGQWRFRFASAFTATAEGTLGKDQFRAGGVSYKDYSGKPAPSQYAWLPDFTTGTKSGLNQAGLSVTGAGDFISIAGEFTSVNNKQFEGIVRFSTKPPKKEQCPRLTQKTWAAPSASSVRPGSALVSIAGNWSRDDKGLKYELYRGDSNKPLQTLSTDRGWWWEPPYVNFTDKTVQPGVQYTYKIRAIDADGNAVMSKPVTVTAATSGPSPYVDRVLRDGASLYYPLGSDTSNPAGGDVPVFGAAATTRKPGAVNGTSGREATAFDGTANSVVKTTGRLSQPRSQTVELWFNSTTNKGGVLANRIGGENAGMVGPEPKVTNYIDRQLYLSDDGRLNFSVKPKKAVAIQSKKAYNDGKWHHAAATIGPDGIALFVDGVEVARDSKTTSGVDAMGYWRVGGENLAKIPDAPSASVFTGAIDEFALYNKVLTPNQIKNHVAAAKTSEPPAPEPAKETQIAADKFERTVSTGWGSADVGGAWTLRGGTASTASVSSGSAKLSPSAGATQFVALKDATAKDVRITTDLSLDAAPAAGASYAGVNARSQGSDSYRALVWMRDNGSVWLVVQRNEEVLYAQPVSGITRKAGDKFTLKAEILGGTTTKINASLWKAGTAQPAAWQASVTDTSAAGLAGTVGLEARRSKSATGPGVVTFDNFVATKQG